MSFTSRKAMGGARVGLLLAMGLLGACGPGAARTNQSIAGITVTDKDQGSTVSAHVGEQVTVVLGSTYWMIAAPSDPAVLRQDGATTVAPQSSCVAGQGCGTVTARFTALGAGTATIRASRTSCGEGAGCSTPATSTYVVTVHVS